MLKLTGSRFGYMSNVD